MGSMRYFIVWIKWAWTMPDQWNEGGSLLIVFRRCYHFCLLYNILFLYYLQFGVPCNITLHGKLMYQQVGMMFRHAWKRCILHDRLSYHVSIGFGYLVAHCIAALFFIILKPVQQGHGFADDIFKRISWTKSSLLSANFRRRSLLRV